MSEQPIVSIVMPSLNVGTYIRECLESVVAQTLQDIEIICVDAGSTDGTLETIKEFASRDPRIKIVMSDMRSYGRQLNLGMQAATGRYMGIVETDDVIAPTMYQRLSETAASSGAEVVKADYYHFTGSGEDRQLTVVRCANAQDMYGELVDPAADARAYCFTIICGNLYSLDFLRSNHISFNETPGASYQDIGFFYQVHGYAHRMFFLNEPFYMYRQDNPGSSINNRGKVYACCVEYDWLRRQLKRDAKVYESSKTYFGRGLFFGYLGALKRISEEFRGEFIERFSKDLRLANSRGELDRELFGAKTWTVVNDIMERPLVYLERLFREEPAIKVSVIIPVYNAAEYLGECLCSVLEQDLRDIEVICVDDGSTDASLEILRKCAARDPRVVVVTQENGGGSVARNHGLELARGEFVAFMDSDDLYPGKNVLSMLYKAAVREHVNAVGGQLERFSPNHPEKIEHPKMFPFLKAGLNVYSRNPFDFCYQLFIFNRKMVLDHEIKFPIVSRYQDPPFMVRAMAAAETFYFIDFPAYRYRFGHQNIDWRKNDYQKTRDMLKSMADVVRFSVAKRLPRVVEATKWRVTHDYAAVLFEQIPTIEEFPEFKDLMAAFPEYTARSIVQEVANRRFAHLFDDGSAKETLSRMETEFGPLELVKQLARTFFLRRDELIMALDRIQYVPQIRDRKIKRVGFMYYMLTTGGVQRVMNMMAPVFQNLGYEVVFIIEKKLDDDCLEVPAGVSVRYVMESHTVTQGNVEKRVQQLSDVIEDEKLDLIYYHSYSSHLLQWDLLTAKLVHRIPFVVHYHNCFGITLCQRSSVPEIAILCAKMRMCEHVLTLSRIDELYFRVQGVQATCMINPVDEKLREALAHSADRRSRFDEQRVIWCGRVSPEKLPLDAIRIFSRVHIALPEVKFLFVGGGSESLMEAVAAEIRAYGLSEVVEVTGNMPDPYPAYETSTAFLMTPEFEGFALTLLEAGVFGVPAVTYAMPFLETVRGNAGVIQVPVRDVKAASDALISILTDRRTYRKMSKATTSHMRTLATFDQKATIKSILDSIQGIRPFKQEEDVVSTSDVRMLLEEIQSCYSSGFKTWIASAQAVPRVRASAPVAAPAPRSSPPPSRPATQQAQGPSARERKLEREIQSLKHSESYRIGMALTWPLRYVYRSVKASRKGKVKRGQG